MANSPVLPPSVVSGFSRIRSVLGVPSGQRLSDLVHERHQAQGVCRDHGVADAGERHAEPLALLALSRFAFFGLPPRPVEAFREQADECAGKEKERHPRRRGRV